MLTSWKGHGKKNWNMNEHSLSFLFTKIWNQFFSQNLNHGGSKI